MEGKHKQPHVICFIYQAEYFPFQLPQEKSLEMSNPAPQEDKGEMSILFITVWCKYLVYIPSDTVYSWVKLPVVALLGHDLEN